MIGCLTETTTCVVAKPLVLIKSIIQFRGDIVKQAMDEDIKNGLHPFFVSTTLGTTGNLINSCLY